MQLKLNWPTLLGNYLKDNRLTPFEWGKFDCCLFAANAVEVMTGHDYASPFRGRYTTQIGASRALKRYGAGDLKSTLIQQLGQPKHGLGIQRGDVCLVRAQSSSGPNLVAGIFWGGVAWVTSEKGLITLPGRFIECYWSMRA